ncbi:beta-glucosidase 12-like [Pyrus ussuriensis x Pyrus communis]|uniref:Beta-glucosidase 12-like n=1 Tax=Pyrus ussuriensis x Pyrus communis TaxID=2448454 RepID=A0A5N5I8E9_9ROSA|nr:beta-glucosidase 12-like [Pyrus ussuriensis x Pyrus communis]
MEYLLVHRLVICISKGIHDLVLYTKEKYNDPLIYIIENGVLELNNPELSLDEALQDTSRIDYYYCHLCYLQALNICVCVCKNGAIMKGYFPWTLLDDFEWDSGYIIRFGLNYMDYDDGLKRHKKRSAH